MDVREKLVELLKEISYDQKLGWYDLWDMHYGAAEDIADLLVAHGVTVQECGEWIQHCFEIECTNCHQEALRDSFNKYVFSNYCPHCGAKMMPQPPKGE